MKDIAVGRLIFLGVAFVVALVAGWFLGEPIRVSEKPSEYIGVAFSILAASLFAVVSIVGDPSMLLPGNWRQGWESAKEIQHQLQRLNLLFLWYLFTLALLVGTELIEYKEWDSLYFVHNIFAFAATFGFIVSFALPYQLQSIQRDRLEQEINQRKKRNDNAS